METINGEGRLKRLTPKMHFIADEIGRFIYEHYDEDYLEVLFSFGLSVDDIIFQVLVLCCRYAYLINAEKHPLSYYIEQEGLEADLARKEHERLIKYSKEKNKLLNDRIEQNIGDRFPDINVHLINENNRFSGYAISAFQYWEIKNIHNMKLVKSIVERRISSSKKVSVDRFKNMSEEYDRAVESMMVQFGKDPDSTIFSSLQLFTLQYKYSFDFYYELAARMEELGIKEIPDMYNRLMTVSGGYKCVSLLPDISPKLANDNDRKIEYPLIIQRHYFIDQIIRGAESSTIDLIMSTFIEANVLANAVRSHMYINKSILQVYIAQETAIEDWASMFEIYNVFRTFVPQKKWTDARIKLVRKMYDVLSVDYKSLRRPENRP